MCVAPAEILKCLKFILLIKQTRTQSVQFSFEKVCKSLKKNDLAQRFKTRFGGLERSGITLAVIWRTQVRGTRRRRAVKGGLHMFATFFLRLFEAKVASRGHDNKRAGFGT